MGIRIKHMSKSLEILTLAGVALISASMAQDVYYEDFSSAPTVRITLNGGSNFIGTGAAAPGEQRPGHVDQNEWLWLYRDGSTAPVYDGVNGDFDITLGNNVYTLIDLSSASAEGTQYTLSFDVSDLSGTVDVMAWAGGGLDYSGTLEGSVKFRTYGNLPICSPGYGATVANVIDGTETVTANGTWTSSTFTLNDLGDAGDYLFLGFENNGASFTIDNLRISASDELPPRLAPSQPPICRDEPSASAPASSPSTLGFVF
jgi:hypothetical protein